MTDRLFAGLRRALCGTAVVLAAVPAHAQVQAELVSAQRSLQPGQPAQLALKLTHEEPWHTFWKNPGTGLPTKLTWRLPDGWSAGPFDWPVPKLLHDKAGAVSGHGYEGVAYLPFKLTVPASAQAGQPVTLEATASWLMCDKVCIPGKRAVSLTLPVDAATPQPEPQVVAALAAMPMPQPAPANWGVKATTEASGMALAWQGSALQDVHFFPESRQLPFEMPQQASADGGTQRLALPAFKPDEGAAAENQLRGVLAYTEPGGARRGVLIDLPLQAAGAAAPQGDASLTPMLLLFALLGGLVLNLMPCVFPVLGIKVMGFVHQAGNDRRGVTLHGLTFTAGVVLSFWVLAGLLALLRAGGDQLGWGFQLQSPLFVFVLAMVMLVFALNLAGLFEIGTRATGIGGELQMKEGLAGSFFAGVLATVVATPCSAPFLAPALGSALALPLGASFVVFTVIALGLALPYLLLSMFPQAIAHLPRPGPWMETFKQAMAFPLLATVAYLMWVLAGQVDDKAFLNALLALTLLAFAGWLYGRFGMAATRGVGRQRAAQAFAAAALVGAVALGWPQAPQAGHDMAWEPWSAERVAALQKEGRPIYVDFTARWCATCQVNKKVVFGSAEVRRYFADQRVAALKADWTNADPLITAELARWQRSAIPFNLVYLPGRADGTPLPELLTPDIVLNALKAAPQVATAQP